MPRQTEYDYYQWFRDSVGRTYGRIPVPSVNDGISLQSVVPAEPATLETEWDGKKVTMRTADGKQQEIKLPPTPEELMKHIHNPRGLKEPVAPPLAFFQKDLPKPGQDNVWIQLYRGAFTQTFAAPVLVHQNDHSTVYVESNYGIYGYLCSCGWCRKVWTCAPGWNGEHYYQFRQSNRSSGRTWQRRYIGHLGAIRQASELGLITGDREIGNNFYLNHQWGNGKWDGGGMLKPYQKNEVIYDVPELPPVPEVHAGPAISEAERRIRNPFITASPAPSSENFF